MSIVVAGCSHRSASLPVLERLTVSHDQVVPFTTRVKAAGREALVLSTCNRTEIYAVVGAESDTDTFLRLLAERGQMKADQLRPHVYVHSGADAVRHALAVASGLDSMVLGEDQIQAQWKRAMTHARVAGALGPMLDRLGAAALACGKRVRTDTGIGRHSVSIESLAVRACAERMQSDLDGREVLVIGAGESATLILRQLATRGARVTVVSRTLHRAAEIATVIDARSTPIDALGDALAIADAVFCCTSAPHPVLGAPHFAERSARRPRAPLVCVDLGVPRDIDASVQGLDGVTVIAIDELASLAALHREQRKLHVPAAERIVAAETARYLEWSAARIRRGHAAASGLADAAELHGEPAR